MDEIHSVLLHRWLSACRELMIINPRVGAGHAASTLGVGREYHLGWNKAKHKCGDKFIFISPEEGKTTSVPPDVPPEIIHDVSGELPELSTTALWHLTQELAQKLSEVDSEPYSRERVAGIMLNILKASEPDLHSNGKIMDEWVHRAFKTMEQALQEKRVDMLLKPALEVVKAYLNFELPGDLAAEILAYILSIQCNFPKFGQPKTTNHSDRLKAIDHLTSVTYRLLRKLRANKKVTPYFELTYLAGLYAQTAAVLAVHERKSGENLDPRTMTDDEIRAISGGIGLSSSERARVDKLALDAEELFAHYSAPSFVLPALFSPVETLGWIITKSSNLKSAMDLADYYCVHPGLGLLLSSSSSLYDIERLNSGLFIFDISQLKSPSLFMHSNEIIKNYQRNSDSYESFDVLEAIKEEESPIAPSNKETMLLKMLAMSIGCSMS